MKRLQINWRGTTPLIMNSCAGVNPLHPIQIEIKKITSKKTKTEEDLINLANLEWLIRLYWDEQNNRPYIPAENIEATIINGAKFVKKGKDIERYFRVLDLKPALDYRATFTKEQLQADLKYRDTRPMNVQRSKVLRTRPRFDIWETKFTAMYDEEKIDLQTIVTALEYAGKYVGTCDSRPKYGQFTTTVVELD